MRRQKAEADGSFDTSFTDEMICPYCGYIQGDEWEIVGKEECGERECNDCGRTFAWTEHVAVHYTTAPPPEHQPPAGGEHD